MNVSKIVTDRFECIDVKATLQDVLPLFKKTSNPCVLVFNGKEYAGMITEKSIVRSIKNLKTGINGLVKKTPRITPDTSIYEAARLMVENQLKQIPVYDKKITGVVTNESLIELAVSTEFGDRHVSTIMSEDVVSVNADERVGKLINIFREEGISRVPVMENGKLAGIATMHDLLQLITPRKSEAGEGTLGQEAAPIRDIRIKDLMTESVITVKPGTTIREAAGIMLKNDIQGIVVLENGGVRGVMTRTDVLLALASMGKLQEENKFTLQMTNGNLVDFDQNYLATSVAGFLGKYEKYLGRGTVNVYFKQHKETFRGTPLVLCRVRLKTDRHYYNARGEGWGADGAFHIAMTVLDRQVSNDKVMREEKRYVDHSSIVDKLDIL